MNINVENGPEWPVDPRFVPICGFDEGGRPVNLRVSAGGGLAIQALVETPSSSVATATGTVPAGAARVTFVSSSDFSGTILGSVFPASSDLTLAAQAGNTLGEIAFEVSAGSLTVYKNTIV